MWAVSDTVGAVVIGRNEGERLIRCLESLKGRVSPIVYVDSGSTDGSPDRARALGAEVVPLDLSAPFTAARARNIGFARLQELLPDLGFVQFVDGDCEIVEGWLEAARARLLSRSELAAVCGRRRERYPEASIYNALCDLEWDTPIGDTTACGGDSMMRVRAFSEVGGFNPELIAGEEPELCFRLRARGYTIERLDHEMTLHDAAMSAFHQWWKRNVRSGHAFAEGAHLHGDSPERYFVRETKRIVAFGAALPAAAVLGALPTLGLSLGLLGAYPILFARVYARTRSRGVSEKVALAYAAAMAIVKFPELEGFLKFHRERRRGTRSKIIEYK